MLDKFFESLYPKVLINVVQGHEHLSVYIEVLAKNKLLEHAYREFHTENPNTELLEFVQTYIKVSPYFYIAYLDVSVLQGALPTCQKNRLSYYYDLSESEYKCFKNRWTFYTDRNSLYALEKRFENVGVDFVFSPFLILQNFFNDKIRGPHIALFVLVQETSLTLGVFKESQLLYARYMELDTQTQEEKDSFLQADFPEEFEDETLAELEDGIDLEDINVDDSVDSLEDFGDIEDLDSLEEIEQFSDHKDIEEELQESADDEEESTEEHFSTEYQHFSLIEDAVEHFYHDERYESEFLENIYIADCVGLSSDLKKFLEDEMFFNVYIRKADIHAELCELTKGELGL